MKSWIGAHNGLPCFFSESPMRVATVDGHVLSSGSSGPVVVADVMAAPGVLTTYQVGDSQVSLIRADQGHEIVSTRTGKRVPVSWIGDDEQSASLSARAAAATRWQVGAPTVRGVARVRTKGADNTQALVEILNERAPIVLVHSPGGCSVPGCDIPPVRIVSVSEMMHSRTGRVDMAVREWELPYETVPTSDHMGGIPVLTWRRWQTHSPGGRWQSKSVETLLREIGGMP